MAVITRIARQKNDKSRYSIYIDTGEGEAYAFGVDEDILIRFNIRKGLELDNETIEAILQADEIRKAFNLCLSFLTYRMRTEKEMIDYMRRKKVADTVIPIVISQLKSRRYLNDLEFAKSYVREKKRTTVKGPRLLAKELRDKGVTTETIEFALEEYSHREQLENATRFALKKAKQYQKESHAAIRQKIGQQLLQKGFKYAMAEAALDELPPKSEEEEWLAIQKQAEKAHRRYGKFHGHEYEQRMKQYLFRKGFSVAQIERVIHEFQKD